MNRDQRESRRRVLVLSIVIPVALLHFVTGPDYGGPFPVFVNGYLIDVLLPLALYYLLSLREYPVLRRRTIRAGLVLGLAFAVETAQYAGMHIFGNVFDPLDYVMYALGVALAVGLDALVLSRLFAFWKPSLHL